MDRSIISTDSYGESTYILFESFISVKMRLRSYLFDEITKNGKFYPP